MAEPLSPADRASLNAERGPVNMTVAGTLIFEGGAGTAYDAILERLNERIHLVPRYRQRLEQPALGLANPVWVDDENFEPTWHVRHSRLPEPGSEAELGAFVGREMSERLDRSRPLWELHVVDGLEGGRAALIPKMHHALVDGVAAIDIGTVLLDPGPEPMELPPPEIEWEPQPYERRRHLARLAATPFLRAQKLMLESAVRALETSPKSAAEDLRRATELVTEFARSRPQAPMTPLNKGISPNRRYALVRADLAALKSVGKSAGGTVNDALLAVVTGMLERYLDAGVGSTPSSRPVALVPVSVRREDERGETGNRISTVFVDLPTEVSEPLTRVKLIGATMRELKESAAVRAGAMMVGATGWAPPIVSSMLVRAMSGVRAFNIVVSNVPGPQQPFYLNGCRLLEAYPVVPLNPANQGLTVGILSYDGGVHFGLLADRDLEPSLSIARDALQAALDELLAAASA